MYLKVETGNMELYFRLMKIIPGIEENIRKAHGGDGIPCGRDQSIALY